MIEEQLESLGLPINSNKTKVMIVRKRKRKSDPITIAGY